MAMREMDDERKSEMSAGTDIGLCLLREAGWLFSLAGGFRKPFGVVDLSCAFWLCEPEGMSGSKLVISGRKEKG